MKKIEIIKSSREYTDIINNSRAKKSKYFSVYYRKNNKSNRYGITVPKKTGPAVTRNKIKRRVKNIIDNNKKVVHNGYEYVIIIKKGILELTYKDKNTAGNLQVGEYPVLINGENLISWDSNITKLEIQPNWRCL